MRTKPIYNFKDADFSNAEGTATITVKPKPTASADLLKYSHIVVTSPAYSSTQYQVVKAKLKGGAWQTPTTQTLINQSDVTVDTKKATHSNAHGGYGYSGHGGGQGQYGQGAYQQQIAAEMAYEQQSAMQQNMDPDGASESYGYAEGNAATPSWAKFLFIPGAILGGVLAWHLGKGKTLDGNAKYLHYGKFIFLGAFAFNVPQIIFEVKPLLAKKAS